MKRRGILAWLLLCSLFVPMGASAAGGEAPTVAAQGAVLMDGQTGRVLWEKNGAEPLAMASTTKIMTAILVLERADTEETVTVSKTAAKQPEVRMGLREGEEWTVGDLLSAMMLRSYNDAAVALAEHVAGSVEAFCAEMTAKAAEIGAADTRFGSPNGLDSSLSPEEHHATAIDMARIAAYAMENPEFRRIVAQDAVTVADKTGAHVLTVTNTDRFLREYAGALGIKTGYTNRAGHCFVGAAERDGVYLITAALGSGWGERGKQQKWTDTKAMMDYGFATFAPYEAVRAGDIFGAVRVADSPTEEVPTVLAAGYTALFSAAEAESLRLEADLPQAVQPPVRAGDVLGRASLWLGEEKLAEIDLLAGADARAFFLRERLGRLAAGWLAWRKF